NQNHRIVFIVNTPDNELIGTILYDLPEDSNISPIVLSC
ncbi:MAG: hypothetical protein FD133_1918, partial [Erysipelotrichaceae bacterium]